MSDIVMGHAATPAAGGTPIVLTAPLTETIDHAGYFIQMSMASLPMWLEGILNRKYPTVAERRVQRGRLGAVHAGRRSRARGVAAAAASRRTTSSCCYPDDLDKFIGPNTRVVAISTHNPLGVTFAAGVYTSIFGVVEAADQLALRARAVRDDQGAARTASNFKVIVGGSGGWQITQTNAWDELGVDCVVEGPQRVGRHDGAVRQGDRGEELPRQIEVVHTRRTATRSSFPTSGRRSASSR